MKETRIPTDFSHSHGNTQTRANTHRLTLWHYVGFMISLSWNLICHIGRVSGGAQRHSVHRPITAPSTRGNCSDLPPLSPFHNFFPSTWPSTLLENNKHRLFESTTARSRPWRTTTRRLPVGLEWPKKKKPPTTPILFRCSSESSDCTLTARMLFAGWKKTSPQKKEEKKNHYRKLGLQWDGQTRGRLQSSL